MEEKAGQPQDSSLDTKLREDLRGMVNNPDLGDVVFVCKDGGRVHACRHLLMARSPVLRSMLANGMAESRLSEISLPDVSSPVLLSTFEYLYTGRIEEYPLVMGTAFQVIDAAGFFLLDDLEKLAREYLLQTTKAIKDMNVAAKSLSVATESLGSCTAVEQICLQLVAILKQGEMEAAHLASLSQRAFSYFLEKTANASTMAFSFEEYLRLRQIVVWCACRISKEAEDLVNMYVPDAKTLREVLKYMRKADRYFPKGDTSLYSRLLGFKEQLATAVASWLPMIDMTRIHPQLLVKVIEPLQIVGTVKLMEAFRFHSLQAADTEGTKVLRWEEGAHGRYYKIVGDGCVLEYTGASFYGDYGYARASMAMWRPNALFEWEVVVEELDRSSVEVGICRFDGPASVLIADQSYSSSSLERQPNGWSVHSSGHLKLTGSNKVFAMKPFGKGSRVGVHFDSADRSCSFSFDGVKWGVAWNHMPDGVYYPAVSLSGNGLARVRLVLISGSEFL